MVRIVCRQALQCSGIAAAEMQPAIRSPEPATISFGPSNSVHGSRVSSTHLDFIMIVWANQPQRLLWCQLLVSPL